MIIRIEDIKEISQVILNAVDATELSVLTETLELNVKNSVLYMSVTNREYYAQVKLNINEDVDFKATVNANLFLKLISQISTETVEFTTNETSLIVKGNGTYKLPLIFDNDKLLELPKITISNVTNEFDIEGNVLNSILQFNSKQLSIGTVSRPVQKMYYVDNNGAITFTSGACVNNFNLEQPVKMLLNSRLVKLFKLFKGQTVHFTLGYDSLSNEITQTKVDFSTPNISITAILSCDDSMINSVPVNAIRGRVTADYPYCVNFNRDMLLETINRLTLFADKNISFSGNFMFEHDFVTVSDMNDENKEVIYYNNDTSNITTPYHAMLDLSDLRANLETCTEQYLSVKFGDGQAVVVGRGNVFSVIPEQRNI